MARTALLAGASGLIGRHCLNQLLSNPNYSEVTSIGRRLPDHEEGKLRPLVSDFSDLDQHAAELAVDDVYIALGTTLRKAGSRAAFERVDYHMVVDLARAARQAGAKRLMVVSAAGTASNSPSFYSRVKARMEQAVAELDFEAIHILRPSLLLGARQESRPAEKLGQIFAPLLSPLLLGPLAIYKPVRAEVVAAAMIQLAFSEATGKQVHHLPLKD